MKGGALGPLRRDSQEERRKLYIALFLLWTGVMVGALTWPWTNFDADFHWNRVVWRPFGETIRNYLDVSLNVVLFLPFGFLGMAARRKCDGGGLLVCAFAGLLLSTGGEILQGFGLRRFPSATDVFANTLGTLLGCLLAWAVDRLSAPKTGL